MPGIDGYVASSWLGFVKPLPAVPVDGGPPQVAVDVPVVLRAYPTPPSMQAQEAKGLNVDAVGATERLREAKGWNYDFLYAKQRVAQDRIHAQVHFNIPKGVRLGALVDEVDLFTALARFTTVHPQIQQTFDQALAGIGLGSDKGSTAFKQAALALDAFTRLIENIGTIWTAWVAAGSHAKSLAALRDSEVQFNFIIDETPVDYQGTSALEVTVRYTDALPPGVASPELVFEGYRAVPPPTVGAEPAAAGEVISSYVYVDADGKPLGWDAAQGIANRRARFARLDVIQYQNAWSSVQITRNDLLVEGNPTRPVFVYTTPLLSFPNKPARGSPPTSRSRSIRCRPTIRRPARCSSTCRRCSPHSSTRARSTARPSSSR